METKLLPEKTAESLHSDKDVQHARTHNLQKRHKQLNYNIYLNLSAAARGIRICEYDHPYSSYGFDEISVWSPKHQHWFSCTTKVVCVEGPMNLAIREFYDRWNAYTLKRFGITNIQFTE